MLKPRVSAVRGLDQRHLGCFVACGLGPTRGGRHRESVTEDAWADLADTFVDESYASVKGYVRTYVMHQQLLEHLPEPPATVLDVGGGAGNQSFPLA
jgi:hypothetical protein